MLSETIIVKIKDLRRTLFWLPYNILQGDDLIQAAAKQIISRELKPDGPQQVKDSIEAGNIFKGLL